MRRIHNLTAFLTCMILCQPFILAAQAGWQNHATVIRTVSSHTAFPDEKRMNGHEYDGKTFDVSHYTDSSVMLIVPKDVKKQDRIDLVFWFHGWYNNIDSALAYFRLADQFIQSGRKAVLVLAETGKDVPDSYGGRLEQQDMFAGLTNDVLATLKQKGVVSKNGHYGNIILAGHSGAYRVIAYILQNGGVPVREVQLFDALYSQVDKYVSWIQKDTVNKFIHWYTSQGGTDGVSVQMMDTLKKCNLSFTAKEETDIAGDNIRSGRVLFIHSQRTHNGVVFNPDSFELLLTQSSLLKPLKK